MTHAAKRCGDTRSPNRARSAEPSASLPADARSRRRLRRYDKRNRRPLGEKYPQTGWAFL